jgi:hypothetical protein
MHYRQHAVIRHCRAVQVLMFAHLAKIVGNPISKRFEAATAYTGERLAVIVTNTLHKDNTFIH